MTKAIIIDDEVKARSLIQTLIRDHCPQIGEIWMAEDLASGVEIIKKENPELVFLDIEMPRESGLKILEYFEAGEINFQIIFVTAYDQYSLEAFRLSAMDYLLKPVDYQLLKKAVDKALRQIGQKGSEVHVNLETLRKALLGRTENKITFSIPKGFLSVKHEDILYFQADSMYTTIFMVDGTEEMICKPMKFFVEQFSDLKDFYRPHRSYFINLKHMYKFERQEGITLVNGKKIPVSPSHVQELKDLVTKNYL